MLGGALLAGICHNDDEITESLLRNCKRSGSSFHLPSDYCFEPINWQKMHSKCNIRVKERDLKNVRSSHGCKGIQFIEWIKHSHLLFAIHSFHATKRGVSCLVPDFLFRKCGTKTFSTGVNIAPKEPSKWFDSNSSKNLKKEKTKNHLPKIIHFSEKIYTNILGPSFFDPKLTRSKLF